jgi:hypothetical protein
MINQMQAEAESQKGMFEALKAGKGGQPVNLQALKKEQIMAMLPKTQDGKQDFPAIMRLVLSPYQKLSAPQVETMLKERFGKHPTAGPLLANRAIMNVVVKLVKDPEALPALAGIAMERQKLATYGGFVLATFFLGSLLKRLLRRYSSDNVGAGLRRFLFRLIVMSGLRFGAFVAMFSKNITPAWEILRGSFFP